VAALRDRHPNIDVTTALDTMKMYFDAICEDNCDAIAACPVAGDIPVRLTHSLKRLTMAYARGQDRSAAMPEDVEAIMPLVRAKLRYLLGRGVQVDGSPEARGLVDEDWVRKQSGEKSAAEWAAEYAQTTGTVVSERTMRRALVRAQARAAFGTYRLPPPAEPRADAASGCPSVQLSTSGSGSANSDTRTLGQPGQGPCTGPGAAEPVEY
jgi:hypothetical protein